MNNTEKINNIEFDENIDTRTFGQSVADRVATFGGSWTFIISFLIFITLWISINVVLVIKNPFDPYPFILLNLILSCIAALQAPIIMMSQNRQEEKDRARAIRDFQINMKAEKEIRILQQKLDHILKHQHQELIEIQNNQIELLKNILDKIDSN